VAGQLSYDWRDENINNYSQGKRINDITDKGERGISLPLYLYLYLYLHLDLDLYVEINRDMWTYIA
tara:strand:- start:500 stop:697 length:198 start_codon:yes stop_codon:yes gene_type:complete